MTLSEHLGQAGKPREDAAFPAYNTDEGIFENNFLEVIQFVVNHTTFDPDDEMDAAVLAALKPLGVEPGKTYDPAQVPAIDGKALAAAAKRIHAEAIQIWAGPRGNPYENDLFKPKGEMTLEPMTVQSAYGPIGLPAHQAVYPGIGTADGSPPNAQHDYVIRMSPEEMPPAKAFWSVTLYDAKNGWFIPNESEEYSVGENVGMKLNDDGEIEIISRPRNRKAYRKKLASHQPDRRALDLVMRIYAADVEKMKTWTPPRAVNWNQSPQHDGDVRHLR